MRPFAVFLLAAAVFGTLLGYERFVAMLPQASKTSHELTPAAGQFSLELILSFDATRDEFNMPDDPALLVRMSGRDLFRADEVDTTEPVTINNVAGVVAGQNSFFVRAVPDAKSIRHACAVRIRILRDGATLAENTIWSTPGDIVAGEVALEVK
jgi:hypothetical protein